MFYPVHLETIASPKLAVLGRRRMATDQLLWLAAGSALLRLGRAEFVLRSGDCFWLPADCLHGLTLLQGCQLGRLRFSIRIDAPRPKAAGFIAPSPLLQALLDRLIAAPQPVAPDSQAGRWLDCIADLLPEWQLADPRPQPLPEGVSTLLEGICLGQSLPAIMQTCHQRHGWNARTAMDAFQQSLGTDLLSWQEQWQLLQIPVLLRQGFSEEQAWQKAGFGSEEHYQQCGQRFGDARTVTTGQTS